MKYHILVALVSLSLSLIGCAATLPPKSIYVPQRVDVAVPVACVKESDIPVEPAYKLDSLDPQANLYEKAVAALEEIEQRKDWQRKAKAVMRSCMTVGK